MEGRGSGLAAPGCRKLEQTGEDDERYDRSKRCSADTLQSVQAAASAEMPLLAGRQTFYAVAHLFLDRNSDISNRPAARDRHPEQLFVSFWREAAMADDDNVNALFGSDSEDEEPPKQAAGQPQMDTKDLFGSSDEEEAPAAHPTTQALGDDEDEPPEEPYRQALPPPPARALSTATCL